MSSQLLRVSLNPQWPKVFTRLFCLLLLTGMTLLESKAQIVVSNATITSPTAVAPTNAIGGGFCINGATSFTITYTVAGIPAGTSNVLVEFMSTGGTGVYADVTPAGAPAVGNGAQTITVTLPSPIPGGPGFNRGFRITVGGSSTSDTTDSYNFATPGTKPNAGADQVMCLPAADSARFTLAATALAAGHTGKWTLMAGAPAGSLIWNTASPTTTFAAANPGVYSLIWADTAKPCGVLTDTVVLTVSKPGATIVASPTTACQFTTPGPTVTFSGANGVAPYTFYYHVNGGGMQTVSSGTLSTATVAASTSVPGTFTYYLDSVSDGAPCKTIISGQSATVTILAAPTGDITGAANVNICSGTSASVNLDLTGKSKFAVSFVVTDQSTGTTSVFSTGVSDSVATAPSGGAASITLPASYFVNNTANPKTFVISWNNTGSPLTDGYALVDANGCAIPVLPQLIGRTSPDNVEIHVSPKPAISVATTTPNTSLLCPGTAVSVQVQNTSGATSTFNWFAFQAGSRTVYAGGATVATEGITKGTNVSFGPGGMATVTTTLPITCATAVKDVEFVFVPVLTGTPACIGDSTAALTYKFGDTTKPVLANVPASVTLYKMCNITDSSALKPAMPTATDNCSTPGITVASTSANTATGKTTTFTWTATDACGNTKTASYTVTQIDSTKPTWATAPGALDVTIQTCAAFDPATTAAPVANDACGTLTITRSYAWYPAATCPKSGYWRIEFTATDNYGNVSAIYVKTVTVIDNVAPAITLSAATVGAKLNVGAGVNCTVPMPDYRAWVTATDCGGVASVEQLAPNAPGISVIGYGVFRTVVFRVTDSCGNTATASFQLNLVDETAPVATCVATNDTLYLDASGNSPVLTMALADAGSKDNCDLNISRTIAKTTFNCSNIGMNIDTLYVKDASNNSSWCTFRVVVLDKIAPVITACAPEQTKYWDAGCTYTLEDFRGLLTVTDNVTNATCTTKPTITQSPAPGSILAQTYPFLDPKNPYIWVKFTVSDASGNTTTCEAKINFKDTTRPALANCQSSITRYVEIGQCKRDITFASVTASDNCNNAALVPAWTTTLTGPTLSANGSSVQGSIGANTTIRFPLGITTVSYSATDFSGNSSSCSWTVEIIELPVTVSSGSIVNPSCVGATITTGSFTATAIGGTGTQTSSNDGITLPTAVGGAYYYYSSLYTTAGDPGILGVASSSWSAASTTRSYTGLAAGTYVYYVRDLCNQTARGTVTINSAGSAPTVTAVPNAVSCAGASDGSVTLTGGVVGTNPTPYVFEQLTPAVATATYTSINTTQGTIAGLPAGSYSIQVRDANNCVGSTSFTITAPANSVSATVAGGATVQQGATAPVVTFTGTNGTAPYTFTYNINGGSSMTVTSGAGSTATISVPTTATGTFVVNLTNVAAGICNAGITGQTASVTVNAVPTGKADLTPSQIFSTLQLNTGETLDMVVAIRNVGPAPTSAPVVFTLTNYGSATGLSVTQNSAASVTIAGTPYTLNNADFDVVTTSVLHTFTSKSGVVIPANGVKLIGIKVARTAGSLGSVTSTVTITDNTGGGETPVLNNSIANTITKL